MAVATLVGVLGTSAGSAFLPVTDSGAWLWSTAKGWATHINGPSGRPDFNVPVPDTRGHRIELSQDGVSVLVSDRDTGVVSRIDPAGMGLLSRPFGHGSFRVVAHGGTAYLVEDATGTVMRIDPKTLDVIGARLEVKAPVTGAGIADDDTLWLSVARSGEMIAIRDGKIIKRVRVGRPDGALAMTIADNQPVAVDGTAPALVPVAVDGPRAPSALPPPAGQGRRLLVAPSLEGRVVPVLVEGTDVMFLVDLAAGSGPRAVRTVRLVGQSPASRLGAPVIAGGRVYVPDDGTGQVLVYDRDHQRFEEPIRIAGGPGLLTLFVRAGSVWINNADGSQAVSVGPDGRRHQVDKYAPGVPEPARSADPHLPQPPQVATNAPRVVVPRVPPSRPPATRVPAVRPPPASRPSTPARVPPGPLPGPGPIVPPSQRPPRTPPATALPPGPTGPPRTAQPPPATTPQQTPPAQPVPVPPPPPAAPGVPGVRAVAAAGAITVTVTAPAAGGLVTSYALTTNPGGTRTLTAPGTVTIAVAGCATATASATATGPGGTSASSATAQAVGCVPPGRGAQHRLGRGPTSDQQSGGHPGDLGPAGGHRRRRPRLRGHRPLLHDQRSDAAGPDRGGDRDELRTGEGRRPRPVLADQRRRAQRGRHRARGRRLHAGRVTGGWPARGLTCIRQPWDSPAPANLPSPPPPAG